MTTSIIPISNPEGDGSYEKSVFRRLPGHVDLIQKVMEDISGLRQFSFIPMLTENDNRNDGNKRGYDDERKIENRPGSKNSELVRFLREYNTNIRDSGKRNFMHIRNYFADKDFRTEIYDPSASGLGKSFTKKERTDYFSKIPENYLNSALVFVDPDNGLQVQKSSEKHILYSEILDLYNRMSDDSLLMIYQHFPRVNHGKYIDRRSADLKKYSKTDTEPVWISDGEIIFFFFAKNRVFLRDLIRIITGYSARYEKKCSSGCGGGQMYIPD